MFNQILKRARNALLTPGMRDACRSCRGAVMVEGALALPLYLILSLTVVDLSRLIFQKVSLQYVANQIIRDAVSICDVDGATGAHCALIDATGGHANCRQRTALPGGYLSQDDLQCFGVERAVLLRDSATSLARGLSLRLDPEDIQICTGNQLNCPVAQSNAGLPEDLVTITIRKNLRPIALIWLPVQIPITVRVVGKNEPYFGV